MNRNRFYILFFLIVLIENSCNPVRKSAAYYQENKKTINALRNHFNLLYKQQSFSAGFTDKSFTYYVMQITTDTLRAVFNNEKRKDALWQNIQKFHYDTSMLKEMAKMMKEIKCLWIGKADHYFGQQRELFNYISFKSADKAFRENKYYILIFLEHAIDYPEMQELIKSGTLVPVDSLVYYTTSNRYR